MIVQRLTWKVKPGVQGSKAYAALHKWFPAWRILTPDTGCIGDTVYADMEAADYAAYQEIRTAWFKKWDAASASERAELLDLVTFTARDFYAVR